MGNVREAYNIAFAISNFKNREDSDERILLDDRIRFTEIAIYDVSYILNDFSKISFIFLFLHKLLILKLKLN